VLDPATAEETKYTIKKDAAYSWVEVFFPKYGWVNFNPTQDRPAGGAVGLGAIDGTAFTDPDLSSLDDLFGDGLEKPVPDDVTGALTETPVQTGQPPWILMWSLSPLSGGGRTYGRPPHLNCSAASMAAPASGRDERRPLGATDGRRNRPRVVTPGRRYHRPARRRGRSPMPTTSSLQPPRPPRVDDAGASGTTCLRNTSSAHRRGRPPKH
jgi:hypothetical protein